MKNYKLVDDYKVYLEKTLNSRGKPFSSRVILEYCKALRWFLNQGYTEATLCASVDTLIVDYSRGGRKYDPDDHCDKSSALKQLKNFLVSGYAVPTPKTSREILAELEKTKGTPFAPCKLPRTGYDPDGGYINYDHFSVDEDMMVPELAYALEGEYEAIYGLARDLFCPPDMQFERIPVILSPKCCYADYEKGNAYLAKEVKELVSKKGDGVSAEEIKYILDNDRFIDRSFGRFFPKVGEPYIEIYYRNVSSSNFKEYVKKLAQCLAHEYMHYVQYKYCELLKAKDMPSELILGSMADFFSVLYSIERKDKVREKIAKARYDLWEERFISLWPHAQALRFYTVGGNTMKFSTDFKDYKDHGCIEKISKMLWSLDKPTDALDILMKF